MNTRTIINSPITCDTIRQIEKLPTLAEKYVATAFYEQIIRDIELLVKKKDTLEYHYKIPNCFYFRKRILPIYKPESIAYVIQNSLKAKGFYVQVHNDLIRIRWQPPLIKNTKAYKLYEKVTKSLEEKRKLYEKLLIYCNKKVIRIEF